MATIFGVPMATGSFTTDASGMQLGDTFFDRRGRQWRLYAVSNDLLNDRLTANALCVIAATNVTYPDSLEFDYTTTTGVSPFYTITNAIANGLDYAAGAPAIDIVAGVADGTIGEAASATAADIRLCLLMTRGFHLVGDNGDDDITAGDHLILATGTFDSTAGACTVDSAAGTDTTTETRGTQRSHVGWAAAADENTDNLVAAHVSIGNF